MSSFEISGGHSLKGELVPQGAKNEALQIISAVLLTSQPVHISNIPDIRDVKKLIELLELMGVKTNRTGQGECTFQADNINHDFLNTADFSKKAAELRGSIMIIGPLLTRFGK